jgi:hypothetical protein
MKSGVNVTGFPPGNLMLHVHPLLGNGLVNKFPQRQILGKESVARLKAIEEAVFSMSSALHPALVMDQ